MKNVLPSFALAVLVATSTSGFAIENGTQVPAQSTSIKPGQFIWKPEAAPTGPVVIVVDLSKTYLQVYRNGVPIGSSTISTGVKDHPTPTGIFTILQKRTTHHSNAYHEASMPYMERLTWDGLAIHAGNVPDHPESHGCVHVPLSFAKKLYEVTHAGTTVLVTDDAAAPAPAKPDLDFSRAKGPIPLPPPGQPEPDFSWKPKRAPSGGVCVVLSSVDKRIYVYREGIEIGRATFGLPPAGLAVGDTVWAADAQTDSDGFHLFTQLGSLSSTPAPTVDDVFLQIKVAAPFLQDLHDAVTTGSTLVMTDQPVNKPNAVQSSILDTAAQ